MSDIKVILVTMGSKGPVTRSCVGLDFHAEMISAVFQPGGATRRLLIPEEQMIAVMDVNAHGKGPEPSPEKIYRAIMPGLSVDLHIDTLARCGRYGPLECLGRRDDKIVRMLLGPRHVEVIHPPDDRPLPIRIRRGPELWPEYRG